MSTALLQCGPFDSAAVGHVGQQVCPEVVEQLLQILAGLGAEILAGEGFDGRLVFADARDLHAHPEFLECAGHEERLAGEAGQEQHAVGVEHEVAGGGGDVIVPGGGGVQVGHHGLAGPLEIADGRAQLLERAEAGAIVDRQFPVP